MSASLPLKPTWTRCSSVWVETFSTLDDGGDPVNRQALADAGERYETAQVQFGKSESVAELLVARSIAVEGIQSTRAVRTRLGFRPGPRSGPGGRGTR